MIRMVFLVLVGILLATFVPSIPSTIRGFIS